MSQWKNGTLNKRTGKRRYPDNDSARLIEAKCGKAHGWMDSLDLRCSTTPAPGHLDQDEADILKGFRLAEPEGKRLMLAIARDVIARMPKSKDGTYS